MPPIMSNHHNHYRSSHRDSSRTRNHHSSSSHHHSLHSRSRNHSSSNLLGGVGFGGSSSNRNLQSHSQSQIQPQSQSSEAKESLGSDWTEHRSSAGKVYYYNTKTGVSQWELPTELRQRLTSPADSEISESSSIRQQDNSPSSSASTHESTQSESVPEDKPLLTPSLGQYFNPELIQNFKSSQTSSLEQDANQLSREALLLNERILKESVDLKIARAVVHYVDISIEAYEKKFAIMKEFINNAGFS